MHISLGHKKQSEKHIGRFEDALTSAFFGTLRYLPQEITIELFQILLESKLSYVNEVIKQISFEDACVEIEFWPSIRNTNGSVIPDLIIKISSAATSELLIVMLIECKWNSGKSSEFQLLDQWERALQTYPQEKLFHIYLVKNLQKESKEREANIMEASNKKDDIFACGWKDRLFVISWYEVLKAVKGIGNQCSVRAVSYWKVDIVAMFDRIGVRGFTGFKSVCVSAFDQIDAAKGIVFWNGAFNGFTQLTDIQINTAGKPIFYSCAKSHPIGEKK